MKQPRPNPPGQTRTYRLLLSHSQLEELLASYAAIRHGVSLDSPAHLEMLTITNKRTGQIEQIRVELTIKE